MVRKRAYKQESEDSDSDYTPDLDEAEPKQYSLRKRTRQTFVEDFDYEVDSDLSTGRPGSEDDDYDLGGENHAASFVNYIEPTISGVQEMQDNPQVDNGLIDFEDIIRADIVINKNRIDYDKVINKTEIKVEKKRGRPPKRKPQIEDFGHSILGPLADVLVPIEDMLESSDDKQNLYALNQHPPLGSCSSLHSEVETEHDPTLEMENLLEPVTEVTESTESSDIVNTQNDLSLPNFANDSTVQKKSELQPSQTSEKCIMVTEKVVGNARGSSNNSIAEGSEGNTAKTKEKAIEEVQTNIVETCKTTKLLMEKSEAEDVDQYVNESQDGVVKNIQRQDDVLIIENNTDVIVLDD